MKQNLTPKERVEYALKKKFIDKVPLTAFNTFWLSRSVENPVIPERKWIPQCVVERNLRNRGLCLIDMANYMGYRIERPNVKVISTVYEENKKMFVRTDYQTPVGELFELKEVNDFTIWWHKKLFSSIDDYKTLLFMIRDTKVLPDYEAAQKAINDYGDDWLLRCDLWYEPLQDLISGEYMTTTDFCIQWMDNRDEILKLYDALTEVRRKQYKIVADSPLFFIVYGGNVHSKIVSPENFIKYYIPHYEEAAEIMHKKGKVIGCHFDSDISIFKELIANTSLDVIEAFTPYPDTELTVKEARNILKDKILWINFPSSMHLQSNEKIEQITEQIIDESGPEALLIGITEDVPEFRWKESVTAIMNSIDKKFNIVY
jgi:hypothetical protein